MKELTALIELLGEEVTLKLVEGCGGTRIFVPEKAQKTTHYLTEMLGDAAMAILVQYHAGSHLAIPQARDWRMAIYERQNLTVREMALKLHVSEKTIYKRRSGKPRSEQFALAFDAPG